MTDAAFALRKAVFARLSADPGLTALLGAGGVLDEVPRGRAPPMLVIGEASLRDLSTSGTKGHEHGLSLVAWSRQGGAREALDIAATALLALDGLQGAIDGHHLVNIEAVSTEVRREEPRRLVKATLRVRAVTEVR